MVKLLVSGSILCDKPLEAIKLYDKSSIDFIHLDIMDGKFVPNKSFTMSQINSLCGSVSKPLDVHLMVSNPSKYIDDLSLLNVSYITFHYEAVKDAMSVINHIKGNGIKAGISIKPSTIVSEIFPLLPFLDMVLIMSVEPGKSGQSFMSSVLYKIDVLRKEIVEKGYKTLISIDGGINEDSVSKVVGVDIVVSASYLLSGNIEDKLKLLRNL